MASPHQAMDTGPSDIENMERRTIHFLRHAQSRHNAYHLVEVDTDLSERGVQQAKSVDRDQRFDLVVCSPLRRCRKTLELSGIAYGEIIYEPLAREWLTSPSDSLPGETYEDEPQYQLNNRIKQLRLKLLDWLKSHNSVLLVAHFYVIGRLTSLDENGEFSKSGMSPNNAEMIKYVFP